MNGNAPKHTTGYTSEITETFAKLNKAGHPILDESGKPEMTTLVTGKKTVRRFKNHTFAELWNSAENREQYNVRVVKAQRLTVERARMTHTDDVKNKDGKVITNAGSYIYSDDDIRKFADKITLTEAASRPKSKRTDMEKAVELFSKLTEAEAAAVTKADKERRAAEIKAA